jgi:EAL domain-containing protein (putative c-di-GMP-specific phosphodiesterase class I)
VKAINRVAHEAGIATIAECVENEETFAALRELAVDFAQGFGVSRPLPLAQLKPEAQRRRPKDPGRAALSRVA